MTQQEDVHFLLDNAPPEEVEYILRCLDNNIAYSTQELREKVLSDWGYSAQKDIAYSTRRLFDLGLADKQKTPSNKVGYALTELGEKVTDILYRDSELYAEVMHFLHYTGYDEDILSSRKLFWSYKLLCETVWNGKKLTSNKKLVETIQREISECFPSVYESATVGGRFNSGGVNNWKRWLNQLTPLPFLENNAKLHPRNTQHFELPLLSLDYVYTNRKYRYGDPVILDDVLLNEISRVFFLDPTNCRELLSLASRLTKVVKLSDTFAGTSITLLEAYDINRL